MEHENGTVVKVNDNRITIRLEMSEQCYSCGAKDCCISLGDENARHLELTSQRKFHAGDKVTIGYDPKSRIISAFLVFIVPLVFLMCGYFVGHAAFGSEGKAILSAFVALGISFVLVRMCGRILDGRQSFTPTIVEAQSS